MQHFTAANLFMSLCEGILLCQVLGSKLATAAGANYSWAKVIAFPQTSQISTSFILIWVKLDHHQQAYYQLVLRKHSQLVPRLVDVTKRRGRILSVNRNQWLRMGNSDPCLNGPNCWFLWNSDCWYKHPYEETRKVLEMRRKVKRAWEEKKRAEENAIAEEAFTHIQ